MSLIEASDWSQSAAQAALSEEGFETAPSGLPYRIPFPAAVSAAAPAKTAQTQGDATSEAAAPPIQLAAASPESMQSYYRLQQGLLRYTLLVAALVFGFVWYFYSLQTALNYLIGACTGVVYLRMLAKSVAELGRQRSSVGSGRLALFIGLIVLSTQWNRLEILPVFLGFLTYKGTLMGYALWAAVLPESALPDSVPPE